MSRSSGLQEDSVPTVNPDELDDDEIQELLKEAERRMRNAQQPKDVDSNVSLPKLDPGRVEKPYIKTVGGIAQASPARLIDGVAEALSNSPRKVEDPIVQAQKIEKEKKATAGPNWFDLPKTDLTPELKRDLQLLHVRNVLDPKRHYKREHGKLKAPEYSQVGTIVEGPTEFFSARIQNKKRKRTLVEEVLAQEEESGYLKRNYGKIQENKKSGKKGFYKSLQARRYPKKR